MGRTKNGIPKTVAGRLVECEAHTLFLGQALRNMTHDPIWYKQVAGELRVLCADHRPSNRLLQYCMNAVGVRIDLNPPSTPPHKWDIVHKGRDVRPHDGPLDFFEFCENGYACTISKKIFKTGEFIRAIAQQEGSSHESDTLDPELHSSYQFILGNLPAHIAQLCCIARTVHSTSVDFLRHITETKGYVGRYQWKDPTADPKRNETD